MVVTVKTIREVCGKIMVWTTWDELVRVLDESGLPFTGRSGSVLLILAAEGLYTCERREHKTETRDAINWIGDDEPPLRVSISYHAGYISPVPDHAVLKHLTPEGHVQFSGRHFVEVAHGTVCDYDVTKDGYLVWLEGDEGPIPVPITDAMMLRWLEDNKWERPDDFIGFDMWYDESNEMYHLKPLYEEVDPVTGARRN